MLTVALQTLRTRWISFAGTLVALVLGVAQVAAMGLLLAATFQLPNRPPERFAQAPAVVYPTDPTWDPAQHDLGVRSLAEAEGVSPALLGRVAATGEVVVDRVFYAQVLGGPADQVGHPWSTARFGGYRLAEGRAPVAADDIVTSGGHPGDHVTVLTSSGSARYTVTGVATSPGYENALFFTDAEAARLSPRINALVAFAPLAAVRAAVGSDALVLTGDDRHRADASEARDRKAIDDTVTLLPVMASVAGTTAVFVVASTFAFAVVQRRRELALLRAVGSTPRQVRRMVLAEAAIVGTVGSVAGAVLGVVGANLLARMLIRFGVSPDWFGIEPSTRIVFWLPLLAAVVTGVVVSLCGALAAAWRAGRVRPLEALRDAAVDDSGMTPGRWMLGGAGLLTALALLGWVTIVRPGTVLSPTGYVPTLLAPVLVAALLAPVAVGPLTRLLTWPFLRLRGAEAILVRAGALTARRRTAAVAAPVLLTVGLSMSVLGATGSVDSAGDQGLRNQVSAEFALSPEGTPGINRAVVDRVSHIAGVRVAAPILTTVYTDDEDRIEENDGLVIDPGALTELYHLWVVAGAVRDLADDTVVTPQSWGYPVGERVEVHLADGTVASLRVVATYVAPRGQDVAYLSTAYARTADYARDGLARRAYLSLAPGTDRDAALAAVRAAIAGSGTVLTTRAHLVATESAFARHLTAVRQRSVAVIVVLFCFIAIVNTLVMAAAGRRRDMAVLRLGGATRRQVVVVFAADALLVAAIGVGLGVLASAVNLAGLWVALVRLFGATPIIVPWGTVAAIAVAATALAVLPVVASLRTDPMSSARTYE